MSAKVNLLGQRFGRLTVVASAPRSIKHVRWECRCDCGELRVVNSISLRNGHTKSCGCLRIDRQRATHAKHGHAKDGAPSPTYCSWDAMQQRCSNPSNTRFHRYGGRGITVCERWGTFENFLADMGERPSRKTLDRYPNRDGNYEPGNCRWATATEQAKTNSSTRTISINGESVCVLELERKLGLSAGVISDRLKRGWSIDRAITTRAAITKTTQVGA